MRGIFIVAAFMVCNVLASLTLVNQAQHFTSSNHVRSSYDYIVVGGGTAGLTVADRLTESGKCTCILRSSHPPMIQLFKLSHFIPHTSLSV